MEISQPRGQVDALCCPQAIADIQGVLGITARDLAPCPIQNAATSRVKTLVQLRSSALLDGLQPDFTRMEQVCIGCPEMGGTSPGALNYMAISSTSASRV